MLYKFSILTPQEIVFQGEISSAVVCGKDGYLEVLAHHAPIIVLMKAGPLRIRDKDNKVIVYKTSTGIFEVSNHEATALVDHIEVTEN